MEQDSSAASVQSLEEAAKSAGSAFENNIEFDTRFRGFDREQVADYIHALTVDYNRICKENDRLMQENIGLCKALVKLGRVSGNGMAKENQGL